MSQHYPVLIVIAPLLSAFVISAAGWLNRRLCFPIALAALLVAPASSVGLLKRVLDEGVIIYPLGGWEPPWGIAYYVDHLNGLVLVVVSIVALVNLIGTYRSVQEEFCDKLGAFYTLYVLSVTGLLGPRLREYVQTLRAMFEAFQHGGKAKFEGEHYRFTLMPPFFNPGPITHAHVPIYLAVVNKYMARLAGELCEGVRLHPIATFSYTRAVVMPQIEAGARRAGRSLKDIDLVGAPFLALGRTREELAQAKQDAKQRITHYASTRTYHSVLEHHGWADVGLQLHDMSLKGQWQEMPGLITDEMLSQHQLSR